MQKQAESSFIAYLKGNAYWLGFKSPRWTLFIAGIVGLSQGLSGFIFLELFVLGLLYYFYHREKGRKPHSTKKEL